MVEELVCFAQVRIIPFAIAFHFALQCSSVDVLRAGRWGVAFFTRLAVSCPNALHAHWAKQHNIIFKVSIPFKHDTVRVVEHTHRTLQEMTLKSLAFKPHLSSAYLGIAYTHNLILILI